MQRSREGGEGCKSMRRMKRREWSEQQEQEWNNQVTVPMREAIVRGDEAEQGRVLEVARSFARRHDGDVPDIDPIVRLGHAQKEAEARRVA